MSSSPLLQGLRRTMAIVSAGVGAAASIAGAQPTLTAVAVTGQQAAGLPAGVTYATLPADPGINLAGNIGFLATLSGTGITTANNTAIWAGSAGTPTLVMQTGTAVPAIGVGVALSQVGPPVLSATGLQVAYESLAAGGTPALTAANDGAVWAGPIGAPILVAREGSQAVGVPAGVNYGTLTTVLGHTGPASSTSIAFGAFLTGTGITTANNLGIWAGTPSSLTLVARNGNAAPGVAAPAVFLSVADVVVAAGGKLAFTGVLTGTGITTANNAGIWAGTPGAPALAARLGTAAPGAGTGVNFSVLGNPVINDAGTIAFVANLTGTGVTGANNVGLWAGQVGSLAMIVRAGAAAPGAGAGVVFGPSISQAVLNGAGQIAFLSSLAGTGVNTDNDSALWLYTPGAPVPLALVAREGDQAPGAAAGVVYRNLNQPPTISPNGQIAYMAFVGGAAVTFANDVALWATDSLGVPGLVLREGDAIAIPPSGTRTVNGITMLAGSGGQEGRRSAFNDLGQLVLRATFTDASAAILLAQIDGPCRVDIDGNSQVLPSDVAAFVSAWSASLSGGTLTGDFDRNGAVEPSDVAAFVTEWFAALTNGC